MSFKYWRNIIHHEPVHVGTVNLTLGGGISTRVSASFVHGRNFDLSGEISSSYIDTHDGLL